jgi:hypothetical protein
MTWTLWWREHRASGVGYFAPICLYLNSKRIGHDTEGIFFLELNLIVFNLAASL